MINLAKAPIFPPDTHPAEVLAWVQDHFAHQ